jgi:hypothetical protein
MKTEHANNRQLLSPSSKLPKHTRQTDQHLVITACLTDFDPEAAR